MKQTAKEWWNNFKRKEEQTKCYCGHTTYCDCGPEEPKQETLKKAAEKYANKIWDYSDSNEKTLHANCNKAFLKGAKWQQKQELYFVHWLMDNCELAEDNSLWMYNSEEYSVEGLFKIYQQFKNK